LRVSGLATIIEDEDDIGPFTIDKNNFAYNIVLIKLKILKAEYFENKHIFSSSFKEAIRNIFGELFFSNAYKHFTF